MRVIFYVSVPFSRIVIPVRGAWLLGLAALNCDRSPVTSELNSEVVPTPSATPNLRIPSPRPFVLTYSFAAFRANKLDYCSDVTLSILPPDNLTSEWHPETMYDLRRSLAQYGFELKQSCREQFSDRTVYATCNATIKNVHERSQMTIFERFYDPLRLRESDNHMMECLHLGGDWKTVSTSTQSSPESTVDDVLGQLKGSTTIQ